MTDTIEPTEEQKQAANAFMLKTRIAEEGSFASAGLARLLAEREHRLREELTAQCNPAVDMCGGCEQQYDAFRVQVKEQKVVLKLSEVAFELVDRFARLNPIDDGFDKAARGLDELRKLLRRDLTAREKELALKTFEAKHNAVKRQKVSAKLTPTAPANGPSCTS